MGKSLSAFAGTMRKLARDLDELAHLSAMAGAEAVLRDWIDVMPVDTSEAISNTQIGINRMPIGPIPAYFRGRKGSTRGASGDRAREEALQTLKTKKPGQTIYISNTAGHITKLDQGSSIQFAGGFLPRALIAFHAAVQAAKTRLT